MTSRAELIAKAKSLSATQVDDALTNVGAEMPAPFYVPYLAKRFAAVGWCWSKMVGLMMGYRNARLLGRRTDEYAVRSMIDALLWLWIKGTSFIWHHALLVVLPFERRRRMAHCLGCDHRMMINRRWRCGKRVGCCPQLVWMWPFATLGWMVSLRAFKCPAGHWGWFKVKTTKGCNCGQTHKVG